MRASDKQIRHIKLTLGILITITALLIYLNIPSHYFSIKFLQASLGDLRHFFLLNPSLSITLYLLSYVTICVFSLPLAAILTLLAGAVFGLKIGFLCALSGSTLGSTVTLILSRFIFHDYIRERFPDKSAAFDREFERNGNAYLLSLRLIPVFPFFITNLLMGLTNIKIRDYVFVSAVGMAPALFAFTYAGVNIAQIDSLASVLSKEVLLSMALIGLLPLISKLLLPLLRRTRAK